MRVDHYAQSASPIGGRLCIRAANARSSALVGVLHLPKGFEPVEGQCHVLYLSEKVRISPSVGLDLDDHMLSSGVGDLMKATIWPMTTDPSAVPVRFIKAFPDENVWTVYGVSKADLTGLLAHRWLDIDETGQHTTIKPPFNASGLAISQLLTQKAVWPGKTGEFYTLPQLQSSWRPHFHAYHQLLASSVSDDQINDNLEKLVASDPFFRQISVGSIDRQYCAYLAELQSRGLLLEDAPQSARDIAEQRKVRGEAFVAGIVGPVRTSKPR